MYLERLLQINLATMAALSALLIGMGERSLVAPLAMCVAAPLSVWLNDVKGFLRLNRTLASLGAIIALLLALRHTMQLEGEHLLLSIAHLLVVLQIILLFQAKDDRTYWQLAMLSLLQVMVATLFNQGVWFGALLVLHMLVGLSAMALLFLVRQHRPYRLADETGRTRPGAPRRRWPLSDRETTLVGSTAGSSRAAVGPEFFQRLAGISLFTLAFSTLVFFALPRPGQSAYRSSGAGQKRLVGFSDSVILGEMGEVLESPEEVLRIRLVRSDSQELYPLREGLYLRGGVLTRYERGRWSSMRDRMSVPRPLVFDPSAPAPPVLQRVSLEPLDRRELFAVWPLSATRNTPPVAYDGRTQRLLRSEADCARRFDYELGTTGFAHGGQAAIVPCDDEVVDDRYLVRLLQQPELPRLSALAAAWVEQSRLPASDRVALARCLEAKLRDSGEFQYSLDGAERNLAIDPIEDFVSEHRAGHCEYFATALAMMLRSQDIPCRVVIGYYSDEWNELGKFFQARQRHAHAWVEAYLRPSQLPEELVAADRQAWAAGGWLRLDPTPGVGGAGQGAEAPGGLRAGWDWLQSAWSNYVLEMDRQRQREAIYQPVVRAIASFWKSLTDAEAWRERLTALGEAMGFASGAARWAAAAVLVAGGALFLLVSGGSIAWLVRRWHVRRRVAGDSRQPRPAPAVPFYRRLERALARLAIVRRPGQTQREFAALAECELTARGVPPSLAVGAGQVVEAFYRVRFGRVPLDSDQAEAVEHAVARLEAWHGDGRRAA